VALPFWILLGAVASQTPCDKVITAKKLNFGKSKWVFITVIGIIMAWGWWNLAVRPYRSMLAMGDVHHAVINIFKRGRKAQKKAGNQQFEAANELDEAAKKLHQYQNNCFRPDRILALHYDIGKLYFAENKYRRALKHLNWCARTAPGMLRSDYYRARSYEERSNNKLARRYFQRYLELHPGDTRAYEHLSRHAPERTWQLLIEQVVQRDRFANGKRVALAGRILADLDKWQQLHAWFEKAKRQSSPQVYKELGSAVSKFCKRTDQTEQTTKLKRHYPHAFHQGNNR
jgi:tetratricopeptide (TPR) repeat protein